MNNEYLLPSNEYNEFESRAYVEPSLQPAQTETFIDKLRETQGAHGQEITAQTEALGTTTPSNLGGLTGAGSYFSSRYQTPRTNALAQNLRTTAQATALNEALANEQAIWKKRYNEAYREYQKREHNKANTPTTDTTTEGGFEIEDSGDDTIVAVTPGMSGGYTTAMSDTDTETLLGYNYVPYGGEGNVGYYKSIGELGKGILSIGGSNGQYDIVTTDGNRYHYIAKSREDAIKKHYQDHPSGDGSGIVGGGGGGR